MKISLITPIYKKSKAVRKYLEHMQQQSNKDFELIIIVDTNNEKVLEVIDQFEELKNKTKLIFNTKRQGRTAAIESGIKIATGEYSVIVSVSNIFKASFIDDAIKVVKSNGTDIIEFNSSFKSPKKIEGEIRKTFNNSVIISENPEIIAMSYPFDFNKIYKTQLLNKVVRENVLLEVNSSLSLSIVYKALLLAETYSTYSKTLITSNVKINSNFNPLKIVRQWKDLFKYVENRHEGKYMQELIYARYFHEVIFLFGFVSASKNKVLLEKLKKNFDDSLKTDFKEFFDGNKYILQKNKETEIIVKNRDPSKFIRLFKEF